MRTIINFSVGRIFLIIAIGLFSLTSFFIISSHFSSLEKTKNKHLSRMLSIANTTQLSLNGEILEELISSNTEMDDITSNESSLLYQTIHSKLKQCYNINELTSPIYTVHKDENSDRYFFGITSSEEPHYRHEYVDPPAILKDIYETGGEIGRYQTERGDWLSVVSPIKNGAGKTIGLLELDLPFEEFTNEARSTLLRKSIISLVVYLVIGLLMFRIISKVVNIENEEKEIKKAKEELKDYQHEQLNSSISYAKRIQKALWPSNETIRKQVADFFAINMPRDVVGGDFYWHHSIEGTNKFVVVHADCTGHGVPGAMMSVLGNSIFNQIVVNYGITEPSQILKLANKKLISLLQQEREENLDDGMAVSIGLVDNDSMTLKFAGADQNAILVRNGQILNLDGDKYPVGGSHFNTERNYNQKTIFLESEDTLYLYSDGFKDQFGGPSNKKFQSSNFYKLLVEHSLKAMDVQKELILNVFRNWKGSQDQIDDVSVIGLKF